jgi:hypothetical protein
MSLLFKILAQPHQAVHVATNRPGIVQRTINDCPIRPPAIHDSPFGYENARRGPHAWAMNSRGSILEPIFKVNRVGTACHEFSLGTAAAPSFATRS